MEKKETLNVVNVAGVLVDKEIELKEGTDKQTGNPYNAISGELVIRTNDGSEIEISLFSKELTKKGTPNSIYKGLVTVMEEYKTLKTNPEEADYIKIGGSDFSVNDYKSKQDGTIKTYNNINAKFFNRLSQKDLEITPLEAKFEVEGVIDSIKDITKKDGTPTGDKIIVLNILGYEGTITPVSLTLPQALVTPFATMGYFEGSVATLWGKIINTKEEKKIVEQAGFGVANEKTVTSTVKRYEITGGKPPVTLNEIGYTQEDYDQAKAKRKVKLDGLLAGNTQGASATQQTVTNPFGQTSSTPVANPFA